MAPIKPLVESPLTALVAWACYDATLFPKFSPYTRLLHPAARASQHPAPIVTCPETATPESDRARVKVIHGVPGGLFWTTCAPAASKRLYSSGL